MASSSDWLTEPTQIKEFVHLWDKLCARAWSIRDERWKLVFPRLLRSKQKDEQQTQNNSLELRLPRESCVPRLSASHLRLLPKRSLRSGIAQRGDRESVPGRGHDTSRCQTAAESRAISNWLCPCPPSLPPPPLGALSEDTDSNLCPTHHIISSLRCLSRRGGWGVTPTWSSFQDHSEGQVGA